MSVNKIILIGHLGKDPEVRKMTNGESVTNVSLATTETRKDKSGSKQEKTEWHNLVFYRRLAEIAGEYPRKGSLVYIEGRIQSRKYTTREGQERYITEIIVNEMQMLGGKAAGQPRQPQSEYKPATTTQQSDDFDIPFGDDIVSTGSWGDDVLDRF